MKNPRGGAAFTLVELMVSVTVFLLLMAMILGVTSQTSTTIRAASAQIDLFQTAQRGFEILTHNLAQATLNTYWDYDNPTTPTTYVRKSDLQFVISQQTDLNSYEVFFQAPRAYSLTTGYNQTSGLLNAMGYYIQYGNDDGFRPTFIKTERWRYRLMQAIQPTESLTLFSNPTTPWIPSVQTNGWPLADNVIAMVLWPRLSLTQDSTGTKLSSNYTYDSRSTGSGGLQLSQMPPVIQITLVAISERSAMHLNMGSSPPSVLTSALQGKFQSVSNYAADLEAVENALQMAKIEYKTFSTNVLIRESKWSGLQ